MGRDKKWYRKQRTQRTYIRTTHGHELRGGMPEDCGMQGRRGDKVGKLGKL